MNNPWDVLPKEPKGDDNINVLYAAVGRALSQWESLESVLGSIFARLCQSDSEAPARAYGTIVSAKGRIDLLREAFACHPARKTVDLQGLPKLLDHVGHFGSRRNEIAHGIAMNLAYNHDDQGCFLCPARYNSKKHFSDTSKTEALNAVPAPTDLEWMWGKYTYNSTQIGYYTARFCELDNRATHFLSALWRWDAEQKQD